MAIGTRCYCPVHSFIVVIEMRALQPIVQHTRSKQILAMYQVQLTAATYTKKNVEGRGREGSNIVVIERGQHTRHSRRRALAQAERLRDGYRWSFLLSSALIPCCDRNACASASTRSK